MEKHEKPNEEYDKHELPVDFDPIIYLELHEDVKKAGIDPCKHYVEFGKKEGRCYNNLVPLKTESIAGIPSAKDSILHQNPNTKRPKLAKHANIWQWVASTANKRGFRVLEIGSRSVVSDALWKRVIPNCEYTGFDVLDGENVDIVGDAHRLSDYFAANSFDLVISFAVFEHLAMPWIVVEEISKILDDNGHVCIETHFSFSEHELPWHFFQFNSRALEVMFCQELGFELLDSGLDTPIVGRFSNDAAEYLRGQLVADLYCHSSIIAKKSLATTYSSTGDFFDWRILIKRLVEESMYPKGSV